MKKIFLIMLVLSLVSAVSENYERPWENPYWMNGNPYVKETWGYVVSDYETLTPLLEKINFDELEEKGVCVAQAEREIDDVLLKREKCEEFHSIERLGQESFTIATIGLVGGIIPTAFVTLWISGERLNLTLECVEYWGEWKEAADAQIEIVETEAREYNNVYEKREIAKKSLEKSGACQQSFILYEEEVCMYEWIDIECNGSGMNEYAPDFSWIEECVLEMNEGKERMEQQAYEMEERLEALEQFYYEKRFEAEQKKEQTKNNLLELEEEKLQKITRQVILEGEFIDFGDIKTTYEQLVKMKNSGDYLLEDGKNRYSYGGSFYLKEGIEYTESAIQLYNSINEGKEGLLDNAEVVVEIIREEARQKIQEVEDDGGIVEEANERYEKAVQEFEAGEVSEELGNSFVHYINAFFYAEEALEINKNKVDLEKIEAGIKEIEDLISRAEADEINIYIEKQQLESIKNSKDVYGLGKLRGIKSSIEEKALVKYGRLQTKRQELIGWIEAGGADFEKYRIEIRSVEGVCGGENELDLICAIGNLKEISITYLEVEQDLKEKKGEIIENGLIVKSEEYIGVVELDEKGDLFLEVIIDNPFKLSAENVVVEIIGVEGYDENDIMGGSEQVNGVVSVKGNLKIYLKEIKENEHLLLRFEKEEVVCYVEEEESYGTGEGYGIARIYREIDLVCTRDASGLVLPEGWNNWELNGKKGTGNIIKRTIRTGDHELKIEFLIEDAYNITKKNYFTNTLGFTTTVECDVEIKSSYSLDTVVIFLSGVDENAENIRVFAYTGETVRNKDLLAGGILTFMVRDVEGVVLVRVKYDIKNISNKVEEKLDEIAVFVEQNNITGKESEIEEINELVKVGEYDEAYVKANEVYDDVLKEIKEREKYERMCKREMNQIKEEVLELERCVGNIIEYGLEDETSLEINARKNYLDGLIETMVCSVNPGATYLELKDVDTNWNTKKAKSAGKELKKEYNEAKDLWLGKGGNETIRTKLNKVNGYLIELSATTDLYYWVEARNLLNSVNKMLSTTPSKNNIEEEYGEELSTAKNNKVEYMEEYNEAKGTDFEKLFSLSSNEIKVRIDEADDEASAGNLDELKELNGIMEGEIDLIRKEAGKKYESLEERIGEVRNEIKNEYIEEATKYLANAKDYYEKEKYVKSLKETSMGYEKLNVGFKEREKGMEGIIVLVLTGLVIVGGIVLYVLNKKEKKGGKKQLKKLKKGSDI
ncbi:hypothetical protein KAW38_00195 [Candidatus Micrarchaeota archaeon]|nr:hypothetical protein [Candidatus Micrarchaeota archaeon]